MRKPNVDRWCAKFVVSLIKNLPKVETFVNLDDVYRIATGYVRRTVDAIRGESEKKRKEVISMKKPVKKPAVKAVAKPAKKCGGKCKK